MFERATAALAELPADLDGAPETVANAVYAVFEVVPSAQTSPAGRGLIEAGLRHRAMLWFVAPAVLKALPELAAEAVQRLKDYAIDAQRLPFPQRPDGSRVNVAVAALCAYTDDALVVPALLELLRACDPYEGRISQVVDSLRSRGQTRAAFDVLLPLLQMSAETGPKRGSLSQDLDVERFREGRWLLASRLDRTRVHAELESRFRGGEPRDDARRLMRVWDASGIGRVARDWLESIGTDKGDQRAQQFLKTLVTHERDTDFTDFARQALGGHVFDDEPEPPREPWTRDDYEKAFDWALKSGRYVDERDNEETATPHDLAWMLSSIASSDPASALARAERWIERQMTADGTSADRGEGLADALLALSSRGLRDARWCDLAAGVARALPPGERSDLLTWLRANV